MPQDQSQAEDVERHENQPAPSAARRQRRVSILTAATLALVLLATAIAYLRGDLNDDGQFRVEPPACATIAPSVHLLGTDYTLRQDENNSCDLILPVGHSLYTPSTQITISYAVLTPHRDDAPDAASEKLEELGVTELPPLAGIGDEAYDWNRNVILRVSNLVVGIVVFPMSPSREDQVLAFATDVANRLRDS